MKSYMITALSFIGVLGSAAGAMAVNAETLTASGGSLTEASSQTLISTMTVGPSGALIPALGPAASPGATSFPTPNANSSSAYVIDPGTISGTTGGSGSASPSGGTTPSNPSAGGTTTTPVDGVTTGSGSSSTPGNGGNSGGNPNSGGSWTDPDSSQDDDSGSDDSGSDDNGSSDDDTQDDGGDGGNSEADD